MATGTELHRIVGAMTDRPWHVSDQPEFVLNDARSEQVCDTYGCRNDIKNAAAIALLANHADALVALVLACESTRGLDTSDPAFWRGMEAMYAALAAVHAIKETP